LQYVSILSRIQQRRLRLFAAVRRGCQVRASLDRSPQQRPCRGYNHRMSIPRCVAIAVLWAASCGAAAAQVAAPRRERHVTVPFLASATTPSALEFEGAECDADATGTMLRCEFQQVFLTAAEVPDTCLITTNRYEKTFTRDGAGAWVSRGPAAGICGVVEVVTLHDGGGVRWTMDINRVVTRKDAAASCAAAEEPPQTLTWQNLRRPLPCRFVQPGGLSR
jgi:hypothetical protein